jgi:hypothetical protein
MHTPDKLTSCKVLEAMLPPVYSYLIFGWVYTDVSNLRTLARILPQYDEPIILIPAQLTLTHELQLSSLTT